MKEIVVLRNSIKLYIIICAVERSLLFIFLIYESNGEKRVLIP